MKYDLKELKKAISLMEKGGVGSISIEIDPMDRLVISFYDSNHDEEIKIILYKNIADVATKMAEITRTSRL